MSSPNTCRRLPFLWLAWSCIGLGAAGVVLPLLPTTPFLLVAAWAAPRGSPRLWAWLHDHSHFGPLLRAWRDHGAVPRRAKWLTLGLLPLSWLTLLVVGFAAPVLAATGVLFLAVGAFIASRPTA
jgi:uncharacterized membrane protein YbaN (DUF454 family)